MRILIFEQRYTSVAEAGIGRFHAFARKWVEEGHKVTVVAGMVNYISGRDGVKSGFWGKEEQDGITVWRVFDRTFGYRSFGGRLWSYFSYWFIGCFLGLFLRRPDVVLASSPPISAGLLGYLVAFSRKARFVFEVRDLWPDEPVELGFLKNKILISWGHWLERFLYCRAEQIVGNSPGIKEYLVSEKGVPKSKVFVVPNAVEEKLFFGVKDFSLREKMGWSEKIIVLYLGSMSSVYDFSTILDAAGKTQNKDILFVMVGDGRRRPEILKGKEEGNLENLLILDAVPKSHVPEFIVAADICVATLRNLSLLRYVYATKAIEYMAGGRPVVLAMEGVTKELVCDNAKGGICVSPENKKEFLDAVEKLAKNEKVRKKLGNSGKKYVEENFSLSLLAGEYLKILLKKTTRRTKAKV